MLYPPRYRFIVVNMKHRETQEKKSTHGPLDPSEGEKKQRLLRVHAEKKERGILFCRKVAKWPAFAKKKKVNSQNASPCMYDTWSHKHFILSGGTSDKKAFRSSLTELSTEACAHKTWTSRRLR